MDLLDKQFANIAINDLNLFVLWRQYRGSVSHPLTMHEVAKSVGLNECYLSKVLNGKCAISLDRFLRVYRFLYLDYVFQNMC